MKHITLALLLVTFILLTACTAQKPNTPLTVAQTFWTATLNGDINTAKQFLTPQSQAKFKVFVQSPKDFVELGEQSITSERAEILTQLTRHQDKKVTKTALRTVLVNQQGQWLVDYEQTKKTMLGSELQSVFDQLSNTMRTTIDKSMELMGESVKGELESIERSLQENMKELDEAIQKQKKAQQQPPETTTL